MSFISSRSPAVWLRIGVASQKSLVNATLNPPHNEGQRVSLRKSEGIDRGVGFGLNLAFVSNSELPQHAMFRPVTDTSVSPAQWSHRASSYCRVDRRIRKPHWITPWRSYAVCYAIVDAKRDRPRLG